MQVVVYFRWMVMQVFCRIAILFQTHQHHRARQSRRYAPNLNMYTYYLNGYFNDTNASFLQYDGVNWQTEVALEKEPLAILGPLRQSILKDDTPSNRVNLKNILIRKALAQEPGYFFDIIRERMKEILGIH